MEFKNFKHKNLRRQDAQKPVQKFCARKTARKRKRTRFGPKKAKPGVFWVLEGKSVGEDGCKRMQIVAENAITFSPGSVSPAGSVGSRQSATGARSPLGTRFWSGCGRAHQGAGKGRCHPVPSASPREGGAGLVLRAIFGEGLCIDYHFFLRKKSTSARRMAKLTRITAG